MGTYCIPQRSCQLFAIYESKDIEEVDCKLCKVWQSSLLGALNEAWRGSTVPTQTELSHLDGSSFLLLNHPLLSTTTFPSPLKMLRRYVKPRLRSIGDDTRANSMDLQLFLAGSPLPPAPGRSQRLPVHQQEHRPSSEREVRQYRCHQGWKDPLRHWCRRRWYEMLPEKLFRARGRDSTNTPLQ